MRQNNWIQQHGLAVKCCLSWAQAPKLTYKPLSAATGSLGRGGTGTKTAVCPTYPSLIRWDALPSWLVVVSVVVIVFYIHALPITITTTITTFVETDRKNLKLQT